MYNIAKLHNDLIQHGDPVLCLCRADKIGITSSQAKEDFSVNILHLLMLKETSNYRLIQKSGKNKPWVYIQSIDIYRGSENFVLHKATTVVIASFWSAINILTYLSHVREPSQ